MQDLHGERTKSTSVTTLVESTAPADPFVLFDTLVGRRIRSERTRRALPEPIMMVVATCVDDQPLSAYRAAQESRDEVTFFTNYNSRKGSELSPNRNVALLFGWYPLHRQVRAEGTAKLVPRAGVRGLLRDQPRESQLASGWLPSSLRPSPRLTS